jgi:hypothetical protein
VANDTNNAQANQQPPEPNPDLNNLGERLVGTWEMSGEVSGTVTYEWMEGGFFLIQHVDLEQYGQRIKGIEIIGHEKPFASEPSEEIKRRYRQMLWIRPHDHAAAFSSLPSTSSPFSNLAPALTNATK